jgi:hypothetical protein
LSRLIFQNLGLVGLPVAVLSENNSAIFRYRLKGKKSIAHDLGLVLLFRIHLKNVFWPNIFVGASILNQNPIFEMDSSINILTRKPAEQMISAQP